MTRPVRIFAGLAAAVTLGFAICTPGVAFAMPPTTTTQQLNLSVSLPTTFTGCSVPITVTEVGTLKTTTFYDQNGNPTVITQHTPRLIGTYFSASGTAYVSESPASTKFDIAANTITYDGLQAHIIIPGQGNAGAATGHVVFNTTTGALLIADGQTTLLTPFSPSVCALLEQ
jgi:hypothetical protein